MTWTEIGTRCCWIRYRFLKAQATVCCIGGALLMTHSHLLGNVKDESLAEMSHTPIALLGIVIGASRWLELRVADHRNTRGIVRLMAWFWPISLIAAGLVLLDYREW
jgi:copper resistance protein D